MSRSSAQQARLFDILSRKHKHLQDELERRHAKAKKWLDKKGLRLEDLRAHSAKVAAGATLGSALLLMSPTIPPIQTTKSTVSTYSYIQQFEQFLHHLSRDSVVDKKVEEEVITNVKKFYGVDTSFELNRNRLPTYHGKMGLEQHLYRYPGDDIAQHTAFHEEGIAPARGAFGYFSEPHDTIKDIEEKERFYIVLQTFLISNWNRDWADLKKWYKFRKFLVINPENGKAVVAVLGDSGPAVWTGKQFGGSPEVMTGLGYYPKKTKGEVIVLFLDDPEDSIRLGPIAQKY